MEFNIPLDELNKIFNMQSKHIEFTSTLYSEDALKSRLRTIGVDVSKENIDAKKTSVVASPGEISRGPFIQTLYAGLEITDYVIILQSNYYVLYSQHNIKHKTTTFPLPHQQIFYGAPGTGKSHGVEEAVKRYGMTAIRTTFHPDSDYSTFVGAYKPQMEAVVLRDYRGEPVQKDGSEVSEKRIVYKFTQQAFLKAYIAAWKNLRRPHVLVIEEINRGNCAQIFGDLFQLLDRDEAGFSKYPIEADTDIKEALEEAFKGLQKTDIAVLHGDTTADDITSGQRLVLPNNLYIWATMNTSDQSLFPIDSAFKRRWEWKYVPISDAGMGWRIAADGAEYDWWSFVERINDKIWDATQSEDKKLGYFFCKADRKRHGGDTENTIISADQFVGKVLFYLYNDVFKNYCFDDDTFQDLPFQSYFKPDGSPQEETVAAFLKRLGVAEIRPADNNGGNKTAED